MIGENRSILLVSRWLIDCIWWLRQATILSLRLIHPNQSRIRMKWFILNECSFVWLELDNATNCLTFSKFGCANLKYMLIWHYWSMFWLLIQGWDSMNGSLLWWWIGGLSETLISWVKHSMVEQRLLGWHVDVAVVWMIDMWVQHDRFGKTNTRNFDGNLNGSFDPIIDIDNVIAQNDPLRVLITL